MYLIANGSLITRVPGDEFFMKDGGVVVVGSRIAEVGTTAELVSKISACGVYRCMRRHNNARFY